MDILLNAEIQNGISPILPVLSLVVPVLLLLVVDLLISPERGAVLEPVR